MTGLASPLLASAGFENAFFTRAGGGSPPPWDSLNVAASTGDDPARVERNLAVAAAALGVAREALYVVTQVHGVACAVVAAADRASEVAARKADVVLSVESGVACAVRTADCVPILVGDRASGAACAIHSGWRGAAQNVARTGVEALRAAIGSRGDLVASIGPHIEACCFDVGDDVARELARASVAGDRVVDASGGRVRVNLRALVRSQLEEAGVGVVDDVAGCTVCDPARFFSHRRDAERSGRLLSAIVARQATTEAQRARR